MFESEVPSAFVAEQELQGLGADYRVHRYAAFMLVSSRTPKWIRVSLFVVTTLLMLAGIASLLVNCDARRPAAIDAPAPAPAKPLVFASHPFLVEIVQRLAGDGVEIVAPWKSSVGDPAFWQPTAEQVRAIQACDLIVLNGAGFEHWTDQAALPRARTLDTTASLKAKFIVVEGTTHSHGPQGEHSHEGTAFTTWLSPEFARVQAHEIAARLATLVPSRAVSMSAAMVEIDATLSATQFALAAVALAAAAQGEQHWLASHPVFQYLGQSADLELSAVQWEPSEMPSNDEWARLAQLRGSQPRAWMIWEGQPSVGIATKLAILGVKVVVVAQYGTADGSVIAGLRASAEAMRDGVAQRVP